MRQFYSFWRIPPTLSAELEICQTAFIEFDRAQILQTASAKSLLKQLSTLANTANRFPLLWLAYVRLLSVNSDYVRQFYETEVLRGGWSVWQLNRPINSNFTSEAPCCRITVNGG